MFFPSSKIVLGSAKEWVHIIQCQIHLHSHVLVIPLVDSSLLLSWQPFPLPLVPLGPGIVHLFLGCFSSNKAINTVTCLYWKLERPGLPFQMLSVHFPSFCLEGALVSILVVHFSKWLFAASKYNIFGFKASIFPTHTICLLNNPLRHRWKSTFSLVVTWDGCHRKGSQSLRGKIRSLQGILDRCNMVI